MSRLSKVQALPLPGLVCHLPLVLHVGRLAVWCKSKVAWRVLLLLRKSLSCVSLPG